MDNFYMAAKRMKAAGDELCATKQWFCSCYLLGYVAECFAKVQIQTYDPTLWHPVKDEYRHDLKRLASDLLILIADSHVPAKYAVDLKTVCTTIVQGQQKWDPVKRYTDQKGTWDTEPVARNYQSEAASLLTILGIMDIDGVI